MPAQRKGADHVDVEDLLQVFLAKVLGRAVDLVADRKTRTDRKPPGKMGGFISKYCRDAGMILRNNGDILVIAPALVMTDDQAEEMIGVLDEAIAAAMVPGAIEGE